MKNIYCFLYVTIRSKTYNKRRDNKNVKQIYNKSSKKNEKNKVEAIADSMVNGQKSKTSHLRKLHYLMSWKAHFREKNI